MVNTWKSPCICIQLNYIEMKTIYLLLIRVLSTWQYAPLKLKLIVKKKMRNLNLFWISWNADVGLVILAALSLSVFDTHKHRETKTTPTQTWAFAIRWEWVSPGGQRTCVVALGVNHRTVYGCVWLCLCVCVCDSWVDSLVLPVSNTPGVSKQSADQSDSSLHWIMWQTCLWKTKGFSWWK